MKRILPILLGAALLLPVAQAAPPKGKEVQMYSKKLDFDEKHKKVRLIGDVKISTDKYTMTAPYAEFFTDKKIGEFQGGVKITGEGTTATGKRMKVFYLEQRAVLSGNVKLVSTKGPGGATGAPTTMTGNELEYQWGKGYGEARGGVKVDQGDRHAFCDKAIYYRDQQMVYMQGNVRVERGDGDWLTSERARMNLATNVIEADGGVTARTLLEEKNKPKPVETPAGPADPVPMEPPFPMEVPTTPPPPRLPGVDE